MVLQQITKPVLEDTDWNYVHSVLGPKMKAAVENCNALGLAAPQVGSLMRVFAFRQEDGLVRIAVNPTLFDSGRIITDYEGCLSLGNLQVTVDRPRKTFMMAFDENGDAFEYESTDLWSRVLQHENDHLNGVLMIDRTEQPLIRSQWTISPLGIQIPKPVIGQGVTSI